VTLAKWVLWLLAGIMLAMAIHLAADQVRAADNYTACKGVFRAAAVDGTLPLNPPHDPFAAAPCKALTERDVNLAWLAVMMELQRTNDVGRE